MAGLLNLKSLFPGDSEMARRTRELDWLPTDFGSPERWPENLKVAVSMCLPSRFPVLLWWGPKFNVLYNDAFLRGAMVTGRATWSENEELYFNRRPPKEEVFITGTYAPMLAPDGRTLDGISA